MVMNAGMIYRSCISGAVPATCHPEGSPILVPFCMPNHCLSCHFALIRPYWRGLSDSFVPYPFSALEGRHDGDVIYLRQRVVNVMQSEYRIASHLREGYCRRTPTSDISTAQL